MPFPALRCFARLLLLGFSAALGRATDAAASLEEIFRAPPAEARPHVMWMWMGSNITKDGITRDLEALHDAGFGGALMFSLADTTTPWPRDIENSPTPEVVAFSPPWWERVRHAALESRRLGLEFGMSNCPGYSSSGGPWIRPEHAMQMVVWSETKVRGGATFRGVLPRPEPDLRGVQRYPVWNPRNGKLERPEHPERREYFRDIAVIAVPAAGVIPLGQVLDLTSRHTPDAPFAWEAPPGDWIVYRFGHTVMGPMLQPPQFAANGFECDKLSREAVESHVNHIVSEARTHLGDLIGSGFQFYHFDSYEAWTPRWTPRMREEFSARRGYDPAPFLPTLAKRIVGSPERSAAYEADLNRTVADLFRENYFPVIRKTLNAAGLRFSSEPYGGPWEIPEITPHLDAVMTEFWTHGGYHPGKHLVETARAGEAAGLAPIQAEAFTGKPEVSQWSETPAWLKSLGDQAYCDGVTRFVLHRFVHQPWGDRLKPGVAMGQWGTHFDHTQTWWEPAKAWVAYLGRCQALLQRGTPRASVSDNASFTITAGRPAPRSVRRSEEGADLFFVANVARDSGAATARFPVADRAPELWHPVTGEIRALPVFSHEAGATIVPLRFADSESFFVVFRRAVRTTSPEAGAENFPEPVPVLPLDRCVWRVAFDSARGGPGELVFPRLVDWKDHPDTRVRYYGGTAVYSTTFVAETALSGRRVWLDLGVVHDIAAVKLNGRDIGVVWTAPWSIEVSAALRSGENQLEIAVTNCWANRLIGDELEPPDALWRKGDMGFGGPLAAYPEWVLKNSPRPSVGRRAFTTWNYFSKDSPLLPSGLLGPLRLLSDSGRPRPVGPEKSGQYNHASSQ